MIGAFIQINADTPRGHIHPIGYVICESGCWEWVGSRTPLGYGYRAKPGPNRMKRTYAHRLMYEALVGPIPEGLELDHKCHNPPCVNPAHLEPVTHAVNLGRSRPAQKSHCVNGHLRSTENQVIRNEGRHCLLCEKANNAKRYPGTPEQRARRKEVHRAWRERQKVVL